MPRSYAHPRRRKPDFSTLASRFAYTLFQLRTDPEFSTPRSCFEEEGMSINRHTYLNDWETLLHRENVENLVELMRDFGIPNPWFFLEEYTRSEIYTVLEYMAILGAGGYPFKKPGGFLYVELERRFGEKKRKGDFRLPGELPRARSLP